MYKPPRMVGIMKKTYGLSKNSGFGHLLQAAVVHGNPHQNKEFRGRFPFTKAVAGAPCSRCLSPQFQLNPFSKPQEILAVVRLGSSGTGLRLN
jgi:hypothetical protein